jgi:hypothetical protein
MQNDPWNENIFNGIKTVNRNLYKNRELLTEKATQLLYGMESCLCSGDGLSAETAFKAADGRVAERVLDVLGVSEEAGTMDVNEGLTTIPLAGNPFGVQRIYFAFGSGESIKMDTT